MAGPSYFPVQLRERSPNFSAKLSKPLLVTNRKGKEHLDVSGHKTLHVSDIPMFHKALLVRLKSVWSCQINMDDDGQVVLFVPNMHCPSCVQHIETLLEPYAKQPTSKLGRYNACMTNLKISWLDHTISFSVHSSGKGPRKISRHFCKQLVKDVIEDLEDGGGFNVESLSNCSTDRPFGEDMETGLALPATFSRQRTPLQPSHRSPAVMSWLLPWRTDQDRRHRQEERARRHLESCTLCQNSNRAEDGDIVNERGVIATETGSARGLYELTLSVEGMTCAYVVFFSPAVDTADPPRLLVAVSGFCPGSLSRMLILYCCLLFTVHAPDPSPQHSLRPTTLAFGQSTSTSWQRQ